MSLHNQRQPMTKKRRILLVDDDTSLLRLLSLRLRAAGFDVHIAGSGEEALGKLPTCQPQLVITDLRMDGMDGMALFDSIHSRYPWLPVFILTAHGSIPDAVEATRKGVFGYLTKPFDSKSLLTSIEDAFRHAPQPVQADPLDPDNSWCRDIMSCSPVMEELLAEAKRAAPSDVAILLQSESGTGKELLARAIHNASGRSGGPFIAVNCAAIPDQLLESELFGHRKGAFTGATRDHAGLFQAADRGTLFLDEVGDMPLEFQAKLLRVLQEQIVRPVGSTSTIPVDVRIISATHRDLEAEVAEGRFRADLYYRLNVIMLEVPALADRREDIPLLANHFLSQAARKLEKHISGFSRDAMELLISAPWPGNVRQLVNMVEQVAVLTTTPVISLTLAQRALRGKTGELVPLAEAQSQFEREYLIRLMQITQGNVTQAARLAKRNRTEFYKLLNRHHLEPALFRHSAG